MSDMEAKFFITKAIPSRRKTIKFLWCERNWMKYETYRFYRKKYNNAIQSNCKLCNYEFKLDDQLTLAAPTKGKNMMLCDRCGEEILKNKVK